MSINYINKNLQHFMEKINNIRKIKRKENGLKIL